MSESDKAMVAAQREAFLEGAAWALYRETVQEWAQDDDTYDIAAAEAARRYPGATDSPHGMIDGDER